MRNPLLVSILALPVVGMIPKAVAQTPTLITSISYEQNKTTSSTTLDVHVGLLQPGSPGYPCASPNTLTVTPEPFHNDDVTSIDGSADENEKHVRPVPEQGGYVYRIPVGVGKDLPVGWETVKLRISAFCNGSTPLSIPTMFVVRRYASASSLEVDVDQPEWNRSGNQDTLSLAIKSTWPTSIHGLVIIDDSSDPTRGNKVTQSYDDTVDAFTHNITLKTLVPLKPRTRYKYQVSFQSGAVSVSPSTALLPFTLPDAPTTDYVLSQLPTPDQLTVKDNSQDFKFTVQTSDPGTLNAVFDALKINGSDTVPGVASDKTYTFTIPKAFLQSDGQYSFHFDGNRTFPKQSLADKHPSVLVVATHATLGGPIGLGLSDDNASLVVRYCLSQQTSNLVRVSNDPTKFSVEGPGNLTKEEIGCKSGMFAYTSSIPLSSFKLQDPNIKPSSDTAKTASSSAPSQVPLQLNIVDASRSSVDPAAVLATLKITGVILPSGANTNVVIDAIKKLQDKNQRDSATKTLLANNVTKETIDALTKKSGVASNIVSVLGQVGKGLITAYFGIPAAPAPKTVATQ
jgi:hypothetical protein